MRLATIFRLFLLAISLFGAEAALADRCTDYATDAYNRALNQCRNGGGDQCRRNSDCAVNQKCDGGICTNAPISCIARCAARYSNGSCYQYGQDYCGVQPACTQYCTARYSNGSCYQYGQDICNNDGGVSCVPNCTARYSNGQCYEYGPDICQ